MDYVYPAVLHTNNDGRYTITYPDLPGCISEGKSLSNAIHMAQASLAQWIEYMLEEKLELPKASVINDIITAEDEFVNLVRVDVKDGRAVKRTVSIPKWMDDKASESKLSLSRVLQDALVQRLQ